MNTSDIIKHCAEKISRETTLDGDVLAAVRQLNKLLVKAGTNLVAVLAKYNNAADDDGYEKMFRDAMRLNQLHEAEIKRIREVAVNLERERNALKKENDVLRQRCRNLTKANVALRSKK